MPRKLVLGIDIDETMNTLMSDILPLYNQKYNDHLTYEDLTEYDVRSYIKPECKDLFDEFCTMDFISKLGIQLGCENVIDRLSQKYHIVYVTATAPNGVLGKHLWLSKHIEKYNFSDLIVMHDKSQFSGDILVDDHLDNLVNFNGTKVLLSKPWNRDKSVKMKNFYRVNDWIEIEKILNLFCKSYVW